MLFWNQLFIRFSDSRESFSKMRESTKTPASQHRRGSQGSVGRKLQRFGSIAHETWAQQSRTFSSSILSWIAMGAVHRRVLYVLRSREGAGPRVRVGASPTRAGHRCVRYVWSSRNGFSPRVLVGASPTRAGHRCVRYVWSSRNGISPRVQLARVRREPGTGVSATFGVAATVLVLVSNWRVLREPGTGVSATLGVAATVLVRVSNWRVRRATAIRPTNCSPTNC